MHDENNHVTIPGFYDNVIELTAEERKALNNAPLSTKMNIKKTWASVEELWGEKRIYTDTFERHRYLGPTPK